VGSQASIAIVAIAVVLGIFTGVWGGHVWIVAVAIVLTVVFAMRARDTRVQTASLGAHRPIPTRRRARVTAGPACVNSLWQLKRSGSRLVVAAKIAAESISTTQGPEVSALPLVSSDPGITERDVAGIRVISASRELDLATAAELCARVDAARHAGRKRLLLDLTRLEFCDSSGLRALIRASEEVRASSGRLVVVPPVAGAVTHLFALTGADELLPLRSSVDDGLAALDGRKGR